MKADPQFLDLLCCPGCSAGLRLNAGDVAPDGHVLSGRLTCTGCGAEYQIQQGVPRFVPAALRDDVTGTVEAFGYQWQQAEPVLKNARFSAPDTFLDFIAPVTAEAFQGKVVLDAGCGSGRFTRTSASFGARLVVGVDLSSAVDQAFEGTRHLPNVLIVQGDILRLPLRPAFDYAFSIGVLHHTENPRQAFLQVASKLSPAGEISAWVYGRENNGWIVHVLDPIRQVTSRLPRPLLLAAAHAVALPLTVAVRCVYGPAARRPALAWLRRRLFYFDYLAFLAQFGYREHAYIVFDHAVPRIAHYIRREEFEDWFAAAGLRHVAITSRAGNSWRGFGAAAGAAAPRRRAR